MRHAERNEPQWIPIVDKDACGAGPDARHERCAPRNHDLHARSVERVISAMRSRLDVPMSNEDMADIACFSPCHFNRMFHRLTGIPPVQFHYALRLERAKRLLVTTELCITEICFEVGYNSLGTFISRFNGLVGLSPSAFRDASDAFTPAMANGWTLAMGAADLNGDLLPEIYIANDFGQDRLLLNKSRPGRLVTLNVDCEYFAELRALDEVEVRMSLAHLRQHRIGLTFNYVASRAGSEVLVARGHQEVGCMRRTPDGLAPTAVPGTLAAALSAFVNP